MKFIKRAKNKSAGQDCDDLMYHLHKALAGHDPARTTKRVHASELFHKDREFCPREFALLDKLNKTRPDEFVSAASRYTFDAGNWHGNWLVHKLADKGLVLGDWQCRHCAHMYELQDRPDKCTKCKHKHFDHIEHRFKSLTSDVSCGVDVIRKTVSGKYRAVEIKSMKKEEFSALAGPLAEHKIRTNLYMRIIEDSSDPVRHKMDTKKAEIVYVLKGGWEKFQKPKEWRFEDDQYTVFKVFEIERDDTKTQTKFEHAIRLKEFREGKKGIPLGLCSSRYCQRAENCAVKQECFSGKYAGSI